MKTVTIAFQLRVPKQMPAADIKAFVLSAIRSEPGICHPDSFGSEVQLYKKRVEVFAP